MHKAATAELRKCCCGWPGKDVLRVISIHHKLRLNVHSNLNDVSLDSLVDVVVRDGLLLAAFAKGVADNHDTDHYDKETDNDCRDHDHKLILFIS